MYLYDNISNLNETAFIVPEKEQSGIFVAGILSFTLVRQRTVFYDLKRSLGDEKLLRSVGSLQYTKHPVVGTDMQGISRSSRRRKDLAIFYRTFLTENSAVRTFCED